ncbi:MAG TPA: MFS transporter [Candidatus Limnocylindria bacterium]|nr:MFS transporter [Candidatus Limnocylindria bacterium]
MAMSDLTRRLASALPSPLRPPPEESGPGLLVPGSGNQRHPLAAFRHRNYRLFWFGQVLSLVGTWMQSVSEPWLVLLLGGSPLQLGIVLALEFAPSMVLAPFGGVLADRMDKRVVITWTQVAAALQAVALFAITVTGVVQIWHIFILAFVLGCINAVNMPVRQAFAAELVPRRDLLNAIALNSASFNAARIVGPAIAGLTLALWGPAVNFGINAVSYVAVLVGLLLMDPARLYRGARATAGLPVLRSIAEGFRYAVRTPNVLWPLVLLGGISIFGLNFQTLLPLFAVHTLGLDPHGDGSLAYGALYGTMGIGSLVGSMSLAFAGSRRPLVRLILGGGVMFVAFELLLGMTRSLEPAFVWVPFIGLASMLMINTINVTVQMGVPDELRGRVMSLYVLVFAGSSPLGGLFAGGVAQLWGAPAGFVLGALFSIVFLAVAGWHLVRNVTMPSLRESPAKAVADEADSEIPRRVAAG